MNKAREYTATLSEADMALNEPHLILLDGTPIGFWRGMLLFIPIFSKR